MGIRFEILYEENSNGMYFTGQVVRGRAVIHVDEQVSIKGIQLKVRGFAKVRWDNGSSNHPDIHQDEEKYFDSTTDCIDTKGTEQTLQPGTHTYTFECVIPLECPSSFEGVYGRIRYDTKITIIRPLTFNKSYSMGFSVLKIFDLNDFPQLRIPAKMEEIKHFCCGPCKSSPLILTLETQRTSYVPGEYIIFNANFLNNSSTKIEQVRMAFILVAFYSVRNRKNTRTERITVAQKKFDASGKNAMEIKDTLQVPPTPPTCDGACPIIKLTYEIAFIVKAKGPHINQKVVIPVTIGNIPYVEKSLKMTENSLISNMINGKAPLSASDTEISPPSYEEAMFVKNLKNDLISASVQNRSSAEKFIPRYPFYNKLDSTNQSNFED